MIYIYIKVGKVLNNSWNSLFDGHWDCQIRTFFIITKSDSENWVWMPIQNFEKFSFLNFLSSQWQCMVQIGKSHCLSPIAIFKFLNFSKLSKTGHIILLYLFIKFVPKFQKWSNIDLIWTIFQFGPFRAEKTRF